MKQGDKACYENIRRDVGNVPAEPDIMQRYSTFGCEAFPAMKRPFNTFIAADSARTAIVIGTSKISID